MLEILILKMLTTPTARKSEKLWPTLSASDGPSTSSFFSDKKMTHVTGSKSMMATPQPKTAQDSDENVNDDEAESEVPAYKNLLGDALANALAKSVSLRDTSKPNGKRNRKVKKTLLFASGMNLN